MTGKNRLDHYESLPKGLGVKRDQLIDQLSSLSKKVQSDNEQAVRHVANVQMLIKHVTDWQEETKARIKLLGPLCQRAPDAALCLYEHTEILFDAEVQIIAQVLKKKYLNSDEGWQSFFSEKLAFVQELRQNVLVQEDIFIDSYEQLLFQAFDRELGKGMDDVARLTAFEIALSDELSTWRNFYEEQASKWAAHTVEAETGGKYFLRDDSRRRQEVYQQAQLRFEFALGVQNRVAQELRRRYFQVQIENAGEAKLEELLASWTQRENQAREDVERETELEAANFVVVCREQLQKLKSPE